MAILCDKDLKEEIFTGELDISGCPIAHTQPASIDLCLGTSYQKLRPNAKMESDTLEPLQYIDPKKEILGVKWQANKQLIMPGEFLLATTEEKVKIPNYLLGRLDGRSSYARLGLEIHATGGVIDPGFQGQITLEMTNNGEYPIMLYSHRRICQLILETLTNPASLPYGAPGRDSKYQGQVGATSSKVNKDKPQPDKDLVSYEYFEK